MRSNGHIKAPSRKRLSGGSEVPEATHQWWTEKAKFVADKEHLAKPSIPLLMTRVSEMDLDLTQEGVNRYKQTRDDGKSKDHPPGGRRASRHKQTKKKPR